MVHLKERKNNKPSFVSVQKRAKEHLEDEKKEKSELSCLLQNFRCLDSVFSDSRTDYFLSFVLEKFLCMETVSVATPSKQNQNCLRPELGSLETLEQVSLLGFFWFLFAFA